MHIIYSVFWPKSRNSFYKNAIRRILPSKSSARRFCGPENGSAILADSKRSLRALRHTQYPPLVEANVLASAQPCLLMLRHGLMSLGSCSPVKPLGFTPPWNRKLFGSDHRLIFLTSDAFASTPLYIPTVV